MPIQPSASELPLPRGWPVHVKSAILHVIGLALCCVAYIWSNPVSGRWFLQVHHLVGDRNLEITLGNARRLEGELVHSGLLHRVLARTEITYSNALIESWWRVLKHQWLYLNTLDTVSAVEKLVRFYIQEHNTRLPHSAFQGQTPDEMYFQNNEHRPHTTLHGRTPNEVYVKRFPADRTPRFELRERWPLGSPCSRPWALVRGQPGAKVQFDVAFHAGRRHLLVVCIKRAA